MLLESIGWFVRDFAEPNHPFVSKLKAKEITDLLNSNNLEKRIQGKKKLDELGNNIPCELDIEELQKSATLNFPQNPLNYLPALAIFLFLIGLLSFVLI